MADPPVPVVIKSGLVELLDDVAGFFRTLGIKTEIAYGRRALFEQSNQGAGGANRIVFAPPDDGKVGEFKRDARPGDVHAVTNDADVVVARARALSNWHRRLIVSVWACDRAKKDDELAQVVAVEALAEKLFQAVNSSPAGSANATWKATTQTIVPVEKIFGAELRIELELRTPVYDVIEELVRPGQTLLPDPPK